MTVHSLAEFLHCDKSTIYRLLKENKIPAFKIGSDWRFIKADIIRWVQRSTVGPKPWPIRGPLQSQRNSL